METVRKRPLWRPKLRAFLDDFRGTIKICLDLRTSPPAPLRETRRKFACSKIVGTYVMGSRNLDPHPPQSRPSTWHVYMGGGVVYFHGVGGGLPSAPRQAVGETHSQSFRDRKRGKTSSGSGLVLWASEDSTTSMVSKAD